MNGNVEVAEKPAQQLEVVPLEQYQKVVAELEKAKAEIARLNELLNAAAAQQSAVEESREGENGAQEVQPAEQEEPCAQVDLDKLQNEENVDVLIPDVE